MQKKRERIAAFDIMRGIFMASIVINHLGAAYGFSLLVLLTGGGGLPVSAAEGFFILSGFMVGYVYAPKMLTNRRSTTKHIRKRAALLYLLSVIFTLLYTAWAIRQPTQQEVLAPYPKGTVSFFYNTFLLRYTYGWTDFLARYAVFMAITPFVLNLLIKGRV